MFELSQLRCFVAVAQELHFGRAALRLNMTQPPLSRQIRLLEHVLEVSLLERSSRSVRLTPAGRAFLPEAQRLLRLAESAGLAVKRVARGEAGSVTVGFTAGSSYRFLPRIVSLAAAEIPDIDLVLKEMVTAEQIDALATNRVDVGFVRMPIDRRGLDVICVMREPLMVAAPRNHPLCSGGDVTIRDLDRQPFIMYSPAEGRYFYDLLTALFQASEIMPNHVQFVHETHTILALVRAGLGIALVPESVQNLSVNGVVLRPIRLKPNTQAELFMVWRRNSEDPALKVFRDLILHKFLQNNLDHDVARKNSPPRPDVCRGAMSQ